MDHFNQYLVGAGMPLGENLTEDEVCNIDLFEQFGTFLSSEAMNALHSGKATTYFSSVKAIFMKKFAHNSIWKDMETVFLDISSKIEYSMNDRCTVGSLSVHQKPPPVGRELMKKIGVYLLGIGGPEDMFNRAILVTAYNAVGRVDEVGRSKWANCYWDNGGECLYSDLNETQIGAPKPMTFVGDSEGYAIDFFHSMACYFVTATEERQSPYWFPKLTNNRAEDIINGILNGLVGKVEGIKADMTGESIRVGTITHMVSYPQCELMHAAVRGGFEDDSGISKLYEHIQCTSVLLNIGGRALNGWQYPRQPCYPPRLVFLGNNDDIVHNMMMELFQLGKVHADFGFRRFGNLYRFAQTMLASLLQSFNSMYSQYGDQHLIVRRILNVGEKYDVTLSHLQAWSDCINSDWKRRNCEQLTATTRGAATLQAVLLELQRLEALIATVQQEQETLNKLTTAAIQQSIAEFQGSSAVSLSKKRRMNETVTLDGTDEDSVSSSAQTKHRKRYRLADTSIELKQLLHDYYQYDLKLACNWDTTNDDTLKDRARAVRMAKEVLDFVLTNIMTAEHQDVLEAPEPAIDTLEHSHWHSRRLDVFMDLQVRTMEHILAREPKTDKKERVKSTGIGAVCNRLQKLPKTEDTSLVSTREYLPKT